MLFLPMISAMGGGSGTERKKRRQYIAKRRRQMKPSAPSNGVDTTGGGGGGPVGRSALTKHRRAHLVISGIKVSPAQPKARHRFPLDVLVKNIGQVQSGEYDLTIFIRDVSNGYKNEIGTFRRKGLRPGKQAAAYSSKSGPIDNPGSYQVQAEIQPFAFGDRTEESPRVLDFAVA